MKLFPLAILALALAGCSGKDDATGNVTAAAPVAAKAAPAGQNWTEVVSKTEEGYRMGNPDAPIKLVEYGSRTCPTCGAFGRDGFQPLQKNYVSTGKVSFEFRDYLVHGVQDLPPALIGQCAGTSPFFPILEQQYIGQPAMFEKLQALSPAQQQQINAAQPAQAIVLLGEGMGMIDFAKQRGIPEAKARACLADKKTVDALTKVYQDATESGTVTGTPTFLINGKKVDALGWTQLEPLLKAAGA